MNRPMNKVEFADDASEHEVVANLASLCCTLEEIGFVLHVSIDYVRKHYKSQLSEGRANAKVTLRRLQWENAKDGNITMLIWLGKQYLGQTDHVNPADFPENVPEMVDKMDTITAPGEGNGPKRPDGPQHASRGQVAQ